MLIDEAIITIVAGRGGDGVVHFRREKYIPKGGPDGGNGGNGGNIYFTGNRDITLLRQFRYKKLLAADDGVSGGGNKCFGANGKDLVITLPYGTLITNLETKKQFEIVNDKMILIARGGIGGRGNWEFKSATNQTPRFAEKGTPGETKKFKLDLQLIADIGLIGLPNAGKSSLLNELTNTQVKTANYPFTTLEPNLGDMHGIIIADIPGLIEDAHKGKGLGFKFLKHVGKTKLLAFCISCEADNPIKEYETVRKELLKYNPDLVKKEFMILLTKSDLVNKKLLTAKLKKLKKITSQALPVSIHDLEAIKKLQKSFGDIVESTK